jgi:hypothetical protein
VAIRKALISEYAAWLRGYLAQGGKITHFYDYPFKGFLFADENILVDRGECGANSRHIIMKSGSRALQSSPGGAFDGWGHTTIYLMDGFSLPATHRWVPVYSDSEFDVLLDDDSQSRRQLERENDRKFRQRHAMRKTY